MAERTYDLERLIKFVEFANETMIRYFKTILISGLLLVANGVGAQRDSAIAFGDSIRRPPCVTPAQDSLLQYLMKNRDGLQTAIEVFDWKQLAWTLVGFLFFAGAAWKIWIKDWLKKYVQEKAEETLEEITSLKNTNILVLTSKTGKDDFLRAFFKAKKFPNVRFERIEDQYKEISDFDCELVFANNDDGKLNQGIAREYYKEGRVFFYFGKERWDSSKDSEDLGRNLNMANSRAQIYGNLMSSLEFLALVKPKIKNV